MSSKSKEQSLAGPPDFILEWPVPWLKVRWVQHLLFWLMITLLSSLNWQAYNVAFLTEFCYYILHISVCILVIYFNFYYLFPRFLLRGKVISYSLFFLASILLGALLRRSLVYFIIPHYFPETQKLIWATKPLLDFRFLVYSFASLLSVVTFAAMLKMAKMWYQKEFTYRILQEEKLAAELRFLKSQINPHFFFNTLNNLYALTLKKSDQAPEVVMELSSMMDYLLHESNADYMPLPKEIKLLKNYLSLEKIRQEESLNVSFFIEGKPAEHQIAPLLFLPFVENAFKHGYDEAASEAWINVELTAQSNQLIFKVENTKPSIPRPAQFTSGIGLQNVQKRLNIIYPSNYDLQFFDENDTFLVVLKITGTRLNSPYDEQ